MIVLLTGASLSLISLLIGFSLGKNQSIVSHDVKKQIKEIFSRVVPNKDVGGITAPTQRDLEFYKNPKLAQEHEIMEKEFDNLIQK